MTPRRLFTIATLLGLGSTLTLEAAWAFSWQTRLDRDGKPPGIYETTPFPLTESSSSYSVTTDEGTVTYQLGTLYFVNAARPDDSGDGRSLATAKKTIRAAISAAGSGNKTILVRAGTYTETGLALPSGVDDTSRFMLCGYGQDRPVINGSSTSSDSVSTLSGARFITFQRFKVQDNYRNGFRSGPTNSSLSVIDVWLYNNCKMDVPTTQYGDGNLYFLGSDDVEIIHSVAEHSDGHCYKIGDGVVGCLVEWSIAKEAGYWPGYHFTTRSTGHPTALDFPADNTTSSPPNENIIARYNIVQTSCYYAVQLRHTRNFDVHHNEISDGIKFFEVGGCEARSLGGLSVSQVLIFESTTFGNFRDNYVHSPGRLQSGALATGVCVNALATAGTTILLYNNVIKGHAGQPGIGVQSNLSSVSCGIYNNTIASATPSTAGYAAVYNRYAGAIWKNNVVHVTGTGAAAAFTAGTRSHNLFYAPSGTLGIALTTGEISVDPILDADHRVRGNSQVIGRATPLPGTFNRDIDGNLRGANWDIGASQSLAPDTAQTAITFP